MTNQDDKKYGSFQFYARLRDPFLNEPRIETAKLTYRAELVITPELHEKQQKLIDDMTAHIIQLTKELQLENPDCAPHYPWFFDDDCNLVLNARSDFKPSLFNFGAKSACGPADKLTFNGEESIAIVKVKLRPYTLRNTRSGLHTLDKKTCGMALKLRVVKIIKV